MLCVTGFVVAQGAEGGWREEVSTAPAGKFPRLPGMRMHFVFGWSNVLEAAKADATIELKGGEYRAMVTGKTEGLARTLWPLDARHSAAILAPSLQPERMAQLERYWNRTIETIVRYDSRGIDRLRKTSNSKAPPKWKRVNFAPIHDVIGGVLYVRSQPLRVGDKIGVVCFPGDSPYLTVVTVEKREKVRCMGRDWPALRLSLDVRKLEVQKNQPTEAVRYAKFRSGTVWVSDDALRLPLRAEVRIFVGFVYGKLDGYEKL